ncbi:hypothetical protein [Caldinitratiruptor microaerophilus]|uniref:Uncharacterized protein n=1 Tax=Caldinitratiruptor microaerophilus TaxID=671077 RepID=A0AA35CK77_9FIRM|nr:hypothetical protein [Caldinitratiruptor microaerophilus]BDG59923.1 hypothetical protein caldi_10130 [Caldinitratiruptor microaerophilus]
MDLRELLNQPQPESWRPEPGGVLVGVVVRIETLATRYGAVPVVTVRPDDGGPLVAVWASHAVLRRELARRRPQVGQKIGIKYLGKQTGRNGASYQAYTVVTEGGNFDWDAAASGAEEEDDIPF